MTAAELYAEAERRGLLLRLEGEQLIATIPEGTDPAFVALLRQNRDVLIAYLRAGWPCGECGGRLGHAVRCSEGPGPAQGPSEGDILAGARLLEWPRIAVLLPGRNRPVVIAPSEASWRAMARWVARQPEAGRALFEALAAFEASWRAEAPTAEEAATR